MVQGYEIYPVQVAVRCRSQSEQVVVEFASLQARASDDGMPLPLQSSAKLMKLSAIAQAIGARLDHGSPDTEITGVAGIEEAAPGEITFVSNPKYTALAR